MFWIVESNSSRGALPILLITDPHPRNQVLVLPFTIRKLDNRIKGLMPDYDSKAIQVGPVTLFPEQKLV
jgi:hypothetical protein